MSKLKLKTEDLVQPAGAIAAALIARQKSTEQLSPESCATVFYAVLQGLIDHHPKQPAKKISEVALPSMVKKLP